LPQGRVQGTVGRMPSLGDASTCVWSPSEVSLARGSFNAIVQHKKANVPEIMQRSSTMSRAALFMEPMVGTSYAYDFGSPGSRYATPPGTPPSMRIKDSLVLPNRKHDMANGRKTLQDQSSQPNLHFEDKPMSMMDFMRNPARPGTLGTLNRSRSSPGTPGMMSGRSSESSYANPDWRPLPGSDNAPAGLQRAGTMSRKLKSLKATPAARFGYQEPGRK